MVESQTVAKTLISTDLAGVPTELQEYPQWVVWEAVEVRRRNGTVKMTKVPYDPKTGRKASIRKREHWGSFEEACEALLDSKYAGLGFVFTPADPFVGVDLDNCYEADGTLRDDAREAIAELQSFTERSPSGKGIHVICRGKLPGSGHCDHKTGREMYQEGRFFTVTGNVVEGLETVKDASAAIRKLHEEWFGDAASNDAQHSLGELEWDAKAPLSSLEDMQIGEAWKELVRTGAGPLAKDYYETSSDDIDRSDALFAVCQEMLRAGQNKESILNVLTDRDYFLAGAPLDRRGDRESAKRWLWDHTLAKKIARERALIDDFDDLPPVTKRESRPPKAGKLGINFTHAPELIHSVEPIEWLIQDYIQTDSMIVMFGEPGVGKSFTAADLACRVATGTPWRGLPVKQGTVFYINGEGQAGFRRRVRGWYLKHKIEPTGLMIGEKAIPLTDKEAALELLSVIRAMVEDYGVPALLVVDTLARNFGGKDENSSLDMGLLVEHLELIKDEFGCSILVIHHPGVNDKKRYRGSSNLKAAVDTEYRLEGKAEQSTRLVNIKMKDGPLAPLAEFYLQQINLELGNDDTTAVPVWDDEFDDLTADDSLQKMPPQFKKIWGMLEQGIRDSDSEILSNKTLVEWCRDQGINKGRVSDALYDFEARNLVTVDRENRPYKIRLKEPFYD